MQLSVPSDSPSFVKLQRFSNGLVWVSRILAFLVLAIPFFAWLAYPHFLPDFTVGPIQEHISPKDATFQTRAICAIADTLFATPLAWALWMLAALFGHFRQGHVFGHFTSTALKRIGQALIAWVVFRFINITLILYLLTSENPSSSGSLSVGISDRDIIALFVGSVVWALAWVFEEARRLQEDNEQIV